MPAVRGLEDYLRTLEIVEPRPLHELQETIIGVDVFQWLRSNNFICKEALHSALGGLPITLEQQAHQQLFEFHKWRIHPLFVFNGLKYSQNARAPFSSSRSRKYAAKRKQAWKSMQNDNIQKAIDLFSQISGYVSISAQDDLIRIFSRWNALIPQRNQSLHAQYLQRQKEATAATAALEAVKEPNYFKPISWIRAPYYAASQMAYLESQEQMLHAVCGGCDLLMFGGEKVILNIDFSTSSYEVTDLEKVLYALGVDANPYCFIDSCLLSGFDASRTFEPLTYSKLSSLADTAAVGRNGVKGRAMRRNFSYQYSLDQVLKKGDGVSVIDEYLCTFNDSASTASYNSNFSASTIASRMSTRSMHSVGGQSARSIKTTRSAMSVRGYQAATNQSSRDVTGNIDKILQHMLTVTNEHESDDRTPADNDQNDANDVGDGEEEKMENPKYREYLNLYFVVRERVCNAKVLSFNGETKVYRPFKWMNEQLLKLKDAQLTQERGDKESEAAAEEKCDEHIPSNVYRLLGVGVLSTFLPSAILGGHLIDTTPLIDSQQLETCMNSVLPLRKRVLDILQHAFGTKNDISLQRWFQPNRDKWITFNAEFAEKWVVGFKYCLNVIFNEKINKIVKSQAITLVTPLKMLAQIRSNKNISNQLFKDGTTSLSQSPAWNVPKITHISQVLTAAYCGTLITLGLLESGNECKLSAVGQSLSKIDKFEFETVLAIEMLKNEDLSEKVLTLIDENGKIYQIDSLLNQKFCKTNINHNLVSKRRTMRLLTRICSILPMRPFIDGKKAWQSKLSHSLAAFNHITTTYHHSIKNCIESAITWLYCHGQPLDNNEMISPLFLKELALSLKQLPPEPCSGVGVLINEFVVNFELLNWTDITESQSDTHKYELLCAELERLSKTFPVFTRMHFAIQCCMQFFYQICTLVKELGDHKILKESVVIQFEDAYEYLREVGVWDAIYFMEINHNKKH